MLEVSHNDFSYWNKGNCKFLTGSQHQICSFLRVLLPMCIHTIWYLSWLSKTSWENGSVYPRKRLQARILQLRLDCIYSQRKLTKERKGVEEGWIFLKIVIMSPIPFSLQWKTSSCFLAKNCEFAKSCWSLDKDQLLMTCTCQCSIDLSFCTEHILRDSPQLGNSSPASLGLFLSVFSLYQHHGITENIQSSLKNSVNAPSARGVEPNCFYFSLQIH